MPLNTPYTVSYRSRTQGKVSIFKHSFSQWYEEMWIYVAEYSWVSAVFPPNLISYSSK